MANFRTDQFDNLPENIDRIGAHRGPKVKGRGWITFAWAVLATAVLVVGGLYVLSIYDSSFKFGLGSTAGSTATPSSTPVPVITPIEDPKTITSRNITVTVLNGTDVVGLDQKASAKLTAKGWNVIATANSTATNLKTSTVYYSTAADEDVAEGIQGLLGAQDIQFSSAYATLGTSITVVIGSDFSG